MIGATIGMYRRVTYSRENKTSLRSTHASITRERYRKAVSLDVQILFFTCST